MHQPFLLRKNVDGPEDRRASGGISSGTPLETGT